MKIKHRSSHPRPQRSTPPQMHQLSRIAAIWLLTLPSHLYSTPRKLFMVLLWIQWIDCGTTQSVLAIHPNTSSPDHFGDIPTEPNTRRVVRKFPKRLKREILLNAKRKTMRYMIGAMLVKIGLIYFPPFSTLLLTTLLLVYSLFSAL